MALSAAGFRYSKQYYALLELLSAAKKTTSDSFTQTEPEYKEELVVIPQCTQTERVLMVDALTATVCWVETTSEFGTQTEEARSESCLSPGVAPMPLTPSTVDGPSQILADFASPRLVRLSSATKEEEIEFDSDMNAFLMSAMKDVLNSGDGVDHRPYSRAISTATELSDWEVPSIDRYEPAAPFDTGLVSGGGIYRTLSAPVLEDMYCDISSCVDTATGLQQELARIRPSKQFVSNVSTLIGEITSALMTHLDKSVSVVPYGSLASNLCLDASTVDLLVVIPMALFEASFAARASPSLLSRETPVGTIKEFELRQSMHRALSKIGELLSAHCGLTTVKLSSVVSLSAISTHSRVPVLTVRDPVTHVTFDIACNNIFPVFSTRLLKAYNSLVPSGEFRDFVLLVKHWARRHGLVGASNSSGAAAGKLNGFSWTLLCLFYAQSCLGVMPSLQALCTERQQWKDPFGSNRRCDVSFEENHRLPPIQLDGVSLFVGFLDYFANYWNWKPAVISVRLCRSASVDSSSVFIRHHEGSGPGSGPTLVLEDPFDIKRDLCLGMGSLARVRNAISDSSLLLASGASAAAVMAPTGSHHGERARAATDL